MNNQSSELSTLSPHWNEELSDDGDQLFFVTSYSDFGKLAHGPRGSEAKESLYVYRFNPSDGSLVLLNIQGDPKTVMNPAFSRYHPQKNVVYTCTEDCIDNGKIIAYKMGPDGTLVQFGDAIDAGGTSTCYLTIDREHKNMLAVNYWDSTLAVIPMDPTTGALQGPIRNMYDPKHGRKMMASLGGCNHSNNDDSTVQLRQADPHSHALVLDPFVGTVAYVPDLGKDLIRELYYDSNAGKIVMEMNILPSGLATGKPDGPRYFEFHPEFNVGYVVNELSSTIAVFEVNRKLLSQIHEASKNEEDMTRFKGRSTLRLVQSIATIPSAFPNIMNTCGRICVHKSGRFVVVSNRGHQSITVYKVKSSGPRRGELATVGYFHTRGETPRHFQFDNSGQYLLVANQDSDSIAVFNFNLSNGDLKYSGNEYRVPSPNFICCCPTHSDEIQTTNTPADIESSVFYRKTSDVSDSDDSTMHSSRFIQKNNERKLLDALDKARSEIAELKRQLAAK